MAGGPAPARPSEAFVGRVAALINEYRSQHRLDRLTSAAVLEQVADGHSQHMAQSGRPSHGGFRDRFRQVDGAICVENIAAHFDTPEALFEGWRRSPSHDRNLLEPRIVRMGLASRDHYVTFFACG
ncbi:MAG: CAP domain-containing protein [Betaproteobacteria bacterium]|nr:CAP domain-containing protein [Betaproteobacteria bacterium]